MPAAPSVLDLSMTDHPGLPETKGFLGCGTSSAQANREELVTPVLMGVTPRTLGLACHSCGSEGPRDPRLPAV